MSKSNLILTLVCMSLAVIFYKRLRTFSPAEAAELEIPKSATRSAPPRASLARTSLPVPEQTTAALPRPARPLNPDDNDTTTVRELKQLVRSNNTCALYKKMNGEHTKDFNKAIIEAYYDLAGLAELNDIFSYYEAPVLRTENDKHQTFFAALSYGDFMYDPREKDLEKARALLEQLAQTDPQNAAYLFYKLAVEQKMGLEEAEVKKTLQRLEGVSHYTSHLTSYHKKLLTRSFESASMYALFNRMGQGYPYLSVYPLQTSFDEVSKDEALRRKLGDLMVKPGLNSTKPYSSYEYSSDEYSVGNGLLYSKYPDISELAQQRAPGMFEVYIETPSADPLECDNKAFEGYTEEMRVFYKDVVGAL